MTYDQISSGMRAFLGTFMTIRSLGYPASSIFLLVEGGVWNARLDHLGNKFTIVLGQWPYNKQGVLEEYAAVLKATSQASSVQISEADLARMVDECEARRHLPPTYVGDDAEGISSPVAAGELK